jgi:hypothetical protein
MSCFAISDALIFVHRRASPAGENNMQRATKKTIPFPAPSPRYAKFAKLFREEGLEVQDDDFELIDLVVKECDRLLDLRSFCR